MNFSEKLDKFLSEYHEKTDISGIVRVTLKDETIYEKCMGLADRENGTPITSDSVFSFYSLSKPFLAIGIMKLQDDGLIDINDHPAKYVPEAKGFDERVTIRQMLSHSSGLPDFEQTVDFKEKFKHGFPEELREQLKELVKYPMHFEPGTSTFYANINMSLCALAIENITGMKYADYMKQNVFKPFNMKTARVDNRRLEVRSRAKGYEFANGVIQQVDRATDWCLGAADIIGTVDDVYCLNKAIKHKLLLKPETWAEILTPYHPNGTFALGCRVDAWHTKKRILHNGGHTGFRTLHIQLPQDDFDIIILSNSGWGDARNDISEEIYKTYYGDSDSVSPKLQMDEGYI